MTTVGWLGAQGTSEAIERFAEMVQALDRRRELDGAMAAATRKQRRRKEERRRRLGYKGQPGSKRKPRRGLLCASVKPRAATGATGSKQKVAGGVA